MTSKRVMVGMSGGVDSAVAAYLLKEAGYEVIGITLRTWVSSDGEEGRCCEIDDAAAACARIGIRFHAFNCTSDFDAKVIKPFIDAYLNGTTPNPCILCNRYIKWEKLLYYADVHKADYIATGHYAHVEKLDNGRYTVRTAAHAKKDQSYMLYKLTQEQLSRTLMPLADLSKDEVRSIAVSAGLLVADKPDSQEICFVPDDDYAGFIMSECEESIPGEGDFTDEEGNVLGRHKGIIHYTIGQRKGLGLAMGHPVFVKSIDAANNRVVICDDESLFVHTVMCRDVNFMSIPGIEPGKKIRCAAKIRYHHTPQDASAYMQGDILVLEFDEPVRAAAAGQSAVMYDTNGCVIGGGIITGSQT